MLFCEHVVAKVNLVPLAKQLKRDKAGHREATINNVWPLGI